VLLLKIESIDIDAAINNVKRLLEKERDLSPAFRSALDVILVLIGVLLNRVTLNSTNSSKPPASDPNRKKGSRKKSDKPSGGQKAHTGTTLQKVADPDEIKIIDVDRSTLPKGQYREVGFEQLSKDQLAQSGYAHADETGININGKGHWLHSLSNEQWTHFFPHENRGCKAMNAIGILPHFKGIFHACFM
jgi:hypothetical protein